MDSEIKDEKQPLKGTKKAKTTKSSPKKRYTVTSVSENRIYLSYEVNGELFGTHVKRDEKNKNLSAGDTIEF